MNALYTVCVANKKQKIGLGFIRCLGCKVLANAE